MPSQPKDGPSKAELAAAARLAQKADALRANLGRRKMQNRARKTLDKPLEPRKALE